MNSLRDSVLQREMNNIVQTNGCLNKIKIPIRVTVNFDTLICLFISNTDRANIKAVQI